MSIAIFWTNPVILLQAQRVRRATSPPTGTQFKSYAAMSCLRTIAPSHARRASADGPRPQSGHQEPAKSVRGRFRFYSPSQITPTSRLESEVIRPPRPHLNGYLITLPP